MQYKTTTKLFNGKYQYKAVLVCPGASWFRSNEFDSALEKLKAVDLSKPNPRYGPYSSHIKTQDELDYAFKLHSVLSKLKDIDIRIESPWVSVYTTSKKDIDKLTKIDESKVKYISEPAVGTSLAEDSIIMPKMNYDYRVTLGKTTHPYPAFEVWAESNKNVKLTKSCKRDLLKERSWGGTHFYITGDNNLLLAKMHLGSSIGKIQRIVKK